MVSGGIGQKLDILMLNHQTQMNRIVIVIVFLPSNVRLEIAAVRSTMAADQS